jgi:hypothetical protein
MEGEVTGGRQRWMDHEALACSECRIYLWPRAESRARVGAPAGDSLIEPARSYSRTCKAVVAPMQKLGVMSYDSDQTGKRY